MAWTDQCKISAVKTIDKVAEDMGVSVKKAIAEVSVEADIPSSTLQRWYYPRNKSEVKNDLTDENSVESNTNGNLEKLEKTHGGKREGSGRKKREKSQNAHWRAVERNAFYLDWQDQTGQ